MYLSNISIMDSVKSVVTSSERSESLWFKTAHENQKTGEEKGEVDFMGESKKKRICCCFVCRCET